MSRMISRDPFTRESLHRDTLTGLTADAPGGYSFRLYECDFCGQVRTTPKGHPQVYRYYTETDGGRRYEHKGQFCCKSCHDSYHC